MNNQPTPSSSSINSPGDLNLFSEINYSELISKSLNEESTLYIIVGSDEGLFPSNLNNFTTPDGTRYLFIELDSKFDKAQGNFERKKNNKSFITAESIWKKTIVELQIESYIHSNRVTLLKSISAATVDKEEYDKLFENISNTLQSLIRSLKTQNEQLFYLEKKLLNLPDLIQPAQLLANKGQGTALVLGAGPSLDQLIPWIKKHEHQVTIIAVSRIYQQLSLHGIEPDIIVSVDPNIVNFGQSRGIFTARNSILIHSTYIPPRLLAQWNGISLFLEEQFPWNHKNNKKNIEVTQPTVTHAAVNIAKNMGFNQILLGGVDLCYLPSGQTHSNKITIADPDTDHELVKTYKGDKTETSFMMRIGITSLAEIVSSFKGEVYNLSSNAAAIENIGFNSEPDLPSSKAPLENIISPDNNSRLDHLKFIQKELASARIKYTEIRKLCKEALKLNLKPAEITNEVQHHAKQKKIDNIEKKLATTYGSFTPVAQGVVAERLLTLLKQTDRLSKTVEENYSWLNEYYTAHLEGTIKVISAIEDAQRTVSQRLEEFKKPLNIKALISNWHNEKLAGRACIWLTNQKDNTLDQDKKGQLLTLCQQFKEISKFPSYIQKIGRQLALKPIEDFSKNNIDHQIHHTSSFIHSIEGENNYLNLYLELLKGVEQQIQSNNTKAANIYKQISEKVTFENPAMIQYLVKGLVLAVIRRLSEIDINLSLDALSRFNQAIFQPGLEQQINAENMELFHLQFNEITRIHLQYSVFEACRNYSAAQNIEALERLAEKLSPAISDDIQFNLISLYISGLINQLNNNPEAASENFTSIINQLFPEQIGPLPDSYIQIAEATLLQMLTLSSNDEKINIYQILSEFLPKYKPKLANILTESGDIDVAVSIYQEYIMDNPSDIESLVNLSDLLIRQKKL